MDALRIEWSRTKQNIDIMIQEMQKEIASTQLPGQDARTDFALESLGGQIVDVKDTSFLRANFLLMLLGLAPVQNEPGNLIRESLSPGDCYAFKGTNSTVTIRLMTKVYIDSVTVQHIPENLAPDGNISSAPKDFSVYGLRTRFDPKPFYFGTFSYNAKLRKPAQVFIFMQVATEKHRYVQFRFFSNHGNANYTCIYRLSVHGRLEMNKSTSDPQT
ncbi:SUN domain-containing protein 3 isoform X2 [Hermetia illucens]|nr:SUN domain-containing protein 3 isoform X2 [Hermetia illucens]